MVGKNKFRKPLGSAENCNSIAGKGLKASSCTGGKHGRDPVTIHKPAAYFQDIPEIAALTCTKHLSRCGVFSIDRIKRSLHGMKIYRLAFGSVHSNAARRRKKSRKFQNIVVGAVEYSNRIFRNVI